MEQDDKGCRDKLREASGPKDERQMMGTRDREVDTVIRFEVRGIKGIKDK